MVGIVIIISKKTNLANVRQHNYFYYFTGAQTGKSAL